MAEQWLSIVEYARNFSLSDMTVRRRIRNGKLNAVLKDGKYFIQVDSPDGTSGVSQALENPKSDPSSMPMASPLGNTKGGAVKAEQRAWLSDRDKSNASLSAHEFDRRLSQTKVQEGQIEPLLNYCERSLNRINSIERYINESYKNKFSFLESENKRKDLMISQLKQQVEDLQILIKMYDARDHR